MTRTENSCLEAQAWVNKAIDELRDIEAQSVDEDDRIEEVIGELEYIEEIVAGLYAEIRRIRRDSE